MVGSLFVGALASCTTPTPTRAASAADDDGDADLRDAAMAMPPGDAAMAMPPDDDADGWRWSLPGMGMPDQCLLPQLAFCDTFQTIVGGGREGDLDPAKWSFTRASQAQQPRDRV